MKTDVNRADAWYLAISDFLEENASERDAEVPGSLVAALCRVVSDAMEGVEGTPEQKLEVVVRLSALAMGLNDGFLLMKNPTGSVN